MESSFLLDNSFFSVSYWTWLGFFSIHFQHPIDLHFKWTVLLTYCTADINHKIDVAVVISRLNFSRPTLTSTVAIKWRNMDINLEQPNF